MDAIGMVPPMWNNCPATGQRQFSTRSDVSDCEFVSPLNLEILQAPCFQVT